MTLPQNLQSEISTLFRVSHTPLQEYKLQGRRILVKRDDLFASWPAPPLGKLRGAIPLLTKLSTRGVRLVGCWDTRISALGQGIAACAIPLGLTVVTAYPAAKGSSTPEALEVARELGAEVLPVKAGRITISFAEARKAIEARGGTMLPFGLECPETVAAIAEEARSVPDDAVLSGTVVVSCGSGTTLAGLIRGFGVRPARFVGVSAGRSPSNIARCIRRHGGVLDRVTLLSATTPYSHSTNNSVPFPSHPNYDAKAWAALEKIVKKLEPPVLFWNVGAAGTGREESSV